MFSVTVRPKNSERSSTTWAMPVRAFLNGDLALTFSPSTVMLPDITGMRPEHVMSVVVLPAPLGPSSATTSPAWTFRFRFRTTGTPA